MPAEQLPSLPDLVTCDQSLAQTSAAPTRSAAQATRLTRRAFFMLACGMTPAHRELFRSLVIVALCFAFAALLWSAGGAVFERPAFDDAGHSDD
jgi:hypothetical protein